VIAKPVSDGPDAVGGVLLDTGPLSRGLADIDHSRLKTADRIARWAIYLGEGIRRRGDCRQHAVHAGRVVAALIAFLFHDGR
jgi:hypothetical protein